MGDNVLVEKDAVHELSVVDRSSDLLDKANVAEVNVGRGRGNEAEDRVDGDGGEDGGVLGDDLRAGEPSASAPPSPRHEWAHLGAQTRAGSPQETLPVVQIHRRRNLLQVLDDLLRRAPERLGNNGRVDALAEELLRCAKEGSRQDDDRRRSVSCLDILRRRKVHELLRGAEVSVSAAGEEGRT